MLRVTKCIQIKHKKTVNSFSPNTLISQKELSGRILRIWMSWSSFEDLFSSLAGSQLIPYLTDANIYGFMSPLSSRGLLILSCFGYGILVDSTSTTSNITQSNPLNLTNNPDIVSQYSFTCPPEYVQTMSIILSVHIQHHQNQHYIL